MTDAITGLRCDLCGAPGAVVRQYYVGGHGYRFVHQCEDRDACRRRQNLCAVCWRPLDGAVHTRAGWLCPDCYRHALMMLPVAAEPPSGPEAA